ncbi:MAG: 4-hydroxy-3-methylbut-2-enyl diphosphate reductase [Candidatus Gracilibacteria bacterium]
MKILKAKSAGFCFGVKRAYELAREAQGENVQTLGELIHNPEVLEELQTKGIKAVSAISELEDGVVIIRAHGISNRKRSELEKKNLAIVDASCPFVKRIHSEVEKFTAAGIPVIIVGINNHPEMQAVVEDFPQAIVVNDVEDSRLQNFSQKKVALLSQTTETEENFQAVAAKLRDFSAEVEIVKTICNATTERQNAAVELAREVEVMIVIGGKNSNNTRKLFQLVSEITRSYWIENSTELKTEWFAGVEKVGITAGASTPEAAIEKVVKSLEGLSY